MIHFKQKLEDYTESEFLDFLNEFSANPRYQEEMDRESYIDSLVDHFDKIVDHPEGNGLIFYPPDDREDSPQGIIGEIKRWRKSQGLPPFNHRKNSDTNLRKFK
ncbi:TPA: bacteriocin immunity protein [Citrobacter koseri]|uniref:Bacteriocin immunity protein n=1 Tax=Citrobacter koseri TaxID=545 RepID=A0AAQ0VCG4_CITKO|nr:MULTISPECIES: bacteriocin immunity protein [Citrobacter]OFV12389.1 bacteriocin immunity protein [Salmonella sp. HMSC13B08]ATF96675.1 bacteriocin immunity protein [Citrobacter koseri]AVE67869.1 bacteriocin immunity protein [Citrobacter koseri]AVK73831.1 bacteriocin immunity protein [Citrobacter koseri]EJK7982044.1 bacteriocin immunity protein [Citrobacter koseri]